MGNSVEMLINIITTTINTKFKDTTPSIENIIYEAEQMRSSLKDLYPLSDEEFSYVCNNLKENILHTIGETITLVGEDSTHLSWYFGQENDGYYWNRYEKYLKSIKRWSSDVVNRLNETTDSVMDNLGNPKEPNRPFQRRGLLLGDVQSGKTATYTAICNKAADAGYRVIIVLAGTMENLRVQTQARLDTEFVGIESRFRFDQSKRGEILEPIGVGKIPPKIDEKGIASFTSVSSDFNKNTLNALGLSLKTLNGTALFVVKKNKSILNNLYKWLIEYNANPTSKLIDLPMVLIDDEADHASVNTNSEEKDPTAINKAIRNILNCFSQASYIGITATPFANIFIDPDSETDPSYRDLFPKDFLTVLPAPDKYIGADKIFGRGDADNWSKEGYIHERDGEYIDSLVSIFNEEQQDYYVFKHKMDLADNLGSLPPSLIEAIRYFILVTSISDVRLDHNEHRSMLINVSRFTKVQNRTADFIESFLSKVKSDLQNYAQLDLNEAMRIHGIKRLHEVWLKYGLNNKTNISWEEILKNNLTKAARRVEVRSVNQEHGASALNYYEHKNTGLRVIAVGGNSLSRGLTLEGLIVSYFYRNTMMYDSLLQMGRWFGYRSNYSDLFKIWMAEDAMDWFGFITDAINELKSELKEMARNNLTPSDFGLKVRSAPGTLLITARNKMRTATSMKRPVTVQGRMLETPRLKGDKETILQNEALCKEFFSTLDSDLHEFTFEKHTKAFIWRNVPKNQVINLVKNFTTHPWNLNFQPLALAEYIENDTGKLDLWDVAIPQSPDSDITETVNTKDISIKVYPKKRPLEPDPNIKNMLKVYGRHVRIGSGGITKIGLSEQQIEKLKEKDVSPKDSTFLKTDRNPLALIHILWNSNAKDDNDVGLVYALGLGFPGSGDDRVANYMVNATELKNWVDITDEDDEDDQD